MIINLPNKLFLPDYLGFVKLTPEHHFSKPGPLKAEEIEPGKLLICLNNTTGDLKVKREG